MALTDSEIQRLRYELGYPNLDTAAEPYIGIAAVFTAVIQPYTLSGAVTTSSTTVAATSTPTPVTLTLASTTGIVAGNAVIVDVDARQERATVQNVVGSTISVLLSLAHSGTYPVAVEGGESIIRGILQKLQQLDGMSAGAAAGEFGSVASTAGVKKLDEIEFFGGAGFGLSRLSELKTLREYWRDELASALGIVRLNGSGSGAGSSLSVY